MPHAQASDSRWLRAESRARVFQAEGQWRGPIAPRTNHSHPYQMTRGFTLSKGSIYNHSRLLARRERQLGILFLDGLALRVTRIGRAGQVVVIPVEFPSVGVEHTKVH